MPTITAKASAALQIQYPNALRGGGFGPTPFSCHIFNSARCRDFTILTFVKIQVPIDLRAWTSETSDAG